MEIVGKTVCSKPWCKATFEVRQDMVTIDQHGNEVFPSICNKCKSQEDFVSWEDKTYEGDRWDGSPHQFAYKIKKFI